MVGRLSPLHVDSTSKLGFGERRDCSEGSAQAQCSLVRRKGWADKTLRHPKELRFQSPNGFRIGQQKISNPALPSICWSGSAIF